MFWTSLGYAQAGSHERLTYYMIQPRTLLIDLRADPYSDYKQWDCGQLGQTWGQRYRQAGPYLGNVQHHTGKIDIPHLEEGCRVLMQYVTEGYNLILLCGCYNLDTCHRKAVVHGFQNMLKRHEMSAFADAYIVEDTPFPGFMNCLSVSQPWATIITRAHLFRALDQVPKNIENRTWMTPWRGRLVIHAGSTFDTGIFKNKMIDPLFWQDRFGVLSASVIPVHKDQYPLGALIGYADLVDIVAESDSPWYQPGQYGFVFENITPIAPIPLKGKARLFQIPEDIINKGSDCILTPSTSLRV